MNLVYLCESFGLSEVADYWSAVLRINDYQRRRFAKLIVQRMFGTIRGKRLAVLGFSFKKDTADTRETPAAYVCAELLEERALLAVYDPKVSGDQVLRTLLTCPSLDKDTIPELESLVECSDSVYAAAKEAHALIVMTEWDEFADLDFERLYGIMVKPAFVFDGRNILPHDELHSIGFEVYAIGKGRDRWAPARSPHH